nr:inorganic phosphate transporter 1-11-like [Tanacetum cinerariifolium]
MASNNLSVLEALDTARTQWYHAKAIVIAGMGFFTDAYDLFCISTVSKLLGRLYFPDKTGKGPGHIPMGLNNLVIGVALVGTFSGQLMFGWLGDKLGRKKVYGITLVLMVICAICSGLSFGHTSKSVIYTLCFFRFWLGFGIGGDYPLSATIMSEYANKRTRGAFIAAVFAMQGLGIIFAGLVSMIVSHAFLKANPVIKGEPIYSTQRNADFAWRIVLMLGALPALLTYYWRMKMPETGRYTAIIEGNAKQAASDMGQVLDIEIREEQEKLAMFKSNNDYPLLSQNDGFDPQSSRSQWSPRNVSAFTCHVPYRHVRWIFAALYALTFFFANFGPNSTTFVLPAELFPTRVRSTCHAISAASGKAGALVSAFGIQKYTLGGDKGKIRTAMMILAMTNMLGFFFTFLLTETKGRSLEEISGEDGSKDKAEAEAEMSSKGRRPVQEI